jgi:N-acetylglucosaminyldiphosphoundecaprenol N-acetyl-beta-D-mannosaminyltransferase
VLLVVNFDSFAPTMKALIMGNTGLVGSEPVGRVLNSPLLLTDYAGLTARCLDWARRPACVALEFANTHVVTLRRHDLPFCKITDAYDFFLPDGMPLVWCLNWRGAGLCDRVYGPTFMKKFLSIAPGEFTHYLLGGSAECGAKLREVFCRLNPAVKFIGGFHGKCRADGTLEGSAEQEVIAEINRLSPDFIWVGLGTPKQQAWIHKHKHQIKRGVLLGVGFAFDANAGTKPDAPTWMQWAGLTWVHRLASEPRRLVWRYLKYNTLFLYYLLWDGLRGRKLAESGWLAGF